MPLSGGSAFWLLMLAHVMDFVVVFFFFFHRSLASSCPLVVGREKERVFFVKPCRIIGRKTPDGVWRDRCLHGLLCVRRTGTEWSKVPEICR